MLLSCSINVLVSYPNALSLSVNAGSSWEREINSLLRFISPLSIALTMIRTSSATAVKIKKHGAKTRREIKIIVHKLVNEALLIRFLKYRLIGLNRIAKTIAQNIGRIKSVINIAKSRLTAVNRMMNTFLLFI